MINIPNTNTRVWNQPNTSDLLGNLFVTKNLTFDEQGYLTLSFRPRAVINEGQDGDFDNVAGMIHNTDYSYFVATWDKAWTVNDAPLSVFPTVIATANVPTTDLQTGVAYINQLLIVTQDTDVDFYDSSSNTWTDTNITLTNDVKSQHPPVQMLSLDAIAIADVNTVSLYDSTSFDATPNLITTLTIPSDFTITQMIYHNQNLYIGTKNVVGGKAAMYVWNGQGTAAQQAYQVNSNMLFTLEYHKGYVFALLGTGELSRFNGGDFEFAAGFPIFYTDMALVDYSNIDMYKDIMKSNGYVLFINFTNTSNVTNALTYQPDGVWCYDDRVGLYHRYSNSNSTFSAQTIGTASVNTTTNQITVANPAFVTGTEVYYKTAGGTAIGGLVNETKYYVINVDATHVQLASTYTNALAGTAIDLTGTGNNSQKLLFFPNIDFGQFYVERTMSALVIDIPSSTRQYGTDVLWSSEVFRRDSQNSSYGTLMVPSPTLGSRGYSITPKIFSKDITNNYDLFVLKWSPFTTDLDKIIIKYRLEDDMRDIIDMTSADWAATWASTTTFTVAPATTVWNNAQVGDEVEVLQGAGGGLLAHIVSITGTTTLTVTLDESYPDYTAGDIAKVVFRNWTKWKTIAYGDSNANQNYIAEHLGLAGQFLQLKIELRGVQTQIVELAVDDVFRLPIKDR